MGAARVAYLGPAGTFSEQAALRYNAGAALIPCSTFTAAAETVAAGEADAAVVAVENSLQGSVAETLDLLIHHVDLRICAEVIVPIEHCLIVAPNAFALNAIKVVLSHPQALGQCRGFLREHLSHAQTEAALSTAEAVEQVMTRPEAAAIAPRRAAELYGATIARCGIEDDHRNATRFVVLANEDCPPSGDDKTSLVFSVHDEPGALVGVLQRFGEAGINLTRIESRPARETLGVYVFLVDCVGHRAASPLAEVLVRLREETAMLKIFGSYARFRA